MLQSYLSYQDYFDESVVFAFPVLDILFFKKNEEVKGGVDFNIPKNCKVFGFVRLCSVVGCGFCGL